LLTVRAASWINPLAAKETTMPAKETAGPADQAIRERAYLLWEQSGRPAGRDLEFWSHAADALAAAAPQLAKRRKTKPATAAAAKRAKSAA
jgi:hypothetical protein